MASILQSAAGKTIKDEREDNNGFLLTMETLSHRLTGKLLQLQSLRKKDFTYFRAVIGHLLRKRIFATVKYRFPGLLCVKSVQQTIILITGE